MAAEALLASRFNLDAVYLAGYTIECTLKALILEVTLPKNKEVMLTKITSGANMHKVEVLIGILKDLGCPIPVEIAKRLRQSQSTWSTALRYQSGRIATGHTRGFLKTAKAVYDWVGRQLP